MHCGSFVAPSHLPHRALYDLVRAAGAPPKGSGQAAGCGGEDPKKNPAQGGGRDAVALTRVRPDGREKKRNASAAINA